MQVEMKQCKSDAIEPESVCCALLPAQHRADAFLEQQARWQRGSHDGYSHRHAYHGGKQAAGEAHRERKLGEQVELERQCGRDDLAGTAGKQGDRAWTSEQRALQSKPEDTQLRVKRTMPMVVPRMTLASTSARASYT